MLSADRSRSCATSSELWLLELQLLSRRRLRDKPPKAVWSAGACDCEQGNALEKTLPWVWRGYVQMCGQYFTQPCASRPGHFFPRARPAIEIIVNRNTFASRAAHLPHTFPHHGKIRSPPAEAQAPCARRGRPPESRRQSRHPIERRCEHGRYFAASQGGKGGEEGKIERRAACTTATEQDQQEKAEEDGQVHCTFLGSVGALREFSSKMDVGKDFLGSSSTDLFTRNRTISSRKRRTSRS